MIRQLSPPAAGRFDPALRRRSQRHGREAGCWLYVSAADLVRSGIDPQAPAPFYRVWTGRRGGLTISLYREG